MLPNLGPKLYLVALSVVGAIILAASAPYVPLEQWSGLVLLAALCAIAQILPIPLSRTTSVSVSAGVTFAGLILYGPIAAIWINLGSALVASFRPRPKPFHKIIFNVANHVLAAAVAGGIYAAAGGTARPSQIGIAIFPVVLAAVGYFLVQTLSISGIIALTEKAPLFGTWNANFMRSGPNFVALTVISLSVASADMSLGTAGTFVFSVPFVMGWYVFKHVHNPAGSNTGTGAKP